MNKSLKIANRSIFPLTALLIFAALLNPLAAIEPESVAPVQKAEPWQQFFDTAKRYSDEASAALKSAETDVSNSTAWKEIAENAQKMAGIKTKAGELGKQGIWGDFDWTEYHQLEGRNNELKSTLAKASKEGEKTVQGEKSKEVEKTAEACSCCTCPPIKST